MRYTALINDKAYTIEIGANSTVLINGDARTVDFRNIEGTTFYSLLMDNHSWEVLVERNGDEYRILIDGELHVVDVQDERTRKLAKAAGKAAGAPGEVALKAPMPGLVLAITVNVGDSVSAKQSILILEAMKMQNDLRPPRAGVVKEIRVKEGEAVSQGQALVIIK